jgi:nitrogen fixation protein NifU and related proteins
VMFTSSMRPDGAYSDLVLQHFRDPRNMGEIEVPDGVGLVGDPECGDYFKVFIRVEDGKLAQVSFKVFGCPAAVATCSMMSEMATGMSVDDAYQLDDLDIMRALGGLPEPKQHCSNHAAAALHRAIDHYVFGGRAERRDSEPS